MALFSGLGEKLNHIFSKLTKRGKLTELEIKQAELDAAIEKFNSSFENINKLELLQEKIDAVEPPKSKVGEFNTNKLLAAIDEKIADLSIEEASEHRDDSVEYGNRMSDALEHYKSSLEMYKKLYADSKDEQYWADILRLQEKISRIESPHA